MPSHKHNDHKSALKSPPTWNHTDCCMCNIFTLDIIITCEPGIMHKCSPLISWWMCNNCWIPPYPPKIDFLPPQKKKKDRLKEELLKVEMLTFSTQFFKIQVVSAMFGFSMKNAFNCPFVLGYLLHCFQNSTVTNTAKFFSLLIICQWIFCRFVGHDSSRKCLCPLSCF